VWVVQVRGVEGVSPPEGFVDIWHIKVYNRSSDGKPVCPVSFPASIKPQAYMEVRIL